MIVSDNGAELTSHAIFRWEQERQIESSSIAPGKPTQNALVKRFNGRLRDECLSKHFFNRLGEARRPVEAWRPDYNATRPNTSLGGLATAAFAHRVRPTWLELSQGSTQRALDTAQQQEGKGNEFS